MAAVREGREPDLDGSEATAGYLKARYPEAGDAEMVATAQQEEMVRALLGASAEREAAEVREREARSRVQALMGDARVLHGQGFRVSWPTISRKGSVNWEAVAAAYRRILIERDADVVGPLDTIVSVHTAPETSYRRFTITEGVKA